MLPFIPRVFIIKLNYHSKWLLHVRSAFLPFEAWKLVPGWDPIPRFHYFIVMEEAFCYLGCFQKHTKKSFPYWIRQTETDYHRREMRIPWGLERWRDSKKIQTFSILFLCLNHENDFHVASRNEWERCKR